jgi:hypothetical protein
VFHFSGIGASLKAIQTDLLSSGCAMLTHTERDWSKLESNSNPSAFFVVQYADSYKNGD